MAERRRYTEEERAVALAALDAHEGNVLKAAAFCKIPRKTLENWRDGGAVNEAVAELRHIKKGELADRLEALAHLLVDAMPEKLAEATLKDAAVALGVSVDKMQLLRNKPTTITDDISSVTDAELDRRIAALERGETQAAP